MAPLLHPANQDIQPRHPGWFTGLSERWISGSLSVAALQKAKKLVQELGGVQDAKQALGALGQLLD
jgi:hypothetical protein